MSDYVSVDAHHIIPLGVFDSLDLEMREEFHKIFDSLQKETNFIFLFPDNDMAKKLGGLKNSGILGDFPAGANAHGDSPSRRFHNGYNDAVEDQIKRILGSNAKEHTKKLMILDLQTALREMLIFGDPKLTTGTKGDDYDKITSYLNSKGLLNASDFDQNGILINPAKQERHSKSAEVETVHDKAKVYDALNPSGENFLYDRNKNKSISTTNNLTRHYLSDFRAKIQNISEIVDFLDKGTVSQLEGSHAKIKTERSTFYKLIYDLEKFLSTARRLG